MELSIIIVSWNTCDLLQACLESVYRNAPDCLFEVLVVDNASKDGSLEMVRGRFPRVVVLSNTRNLGFASANNQAIAISSGRYILLLNSDTVVMPGALEKLIEFFEQHPRAGAAGGHLLNPDGSLQYSCSPSPTLRSEARRLLRMPGVRTDGYYPMETWDLHKYHEVDVLLGACLMLRKEVLNTVGVLDETYFMYSEEVDLCRRVQLAGWKLFWVPNAFVLHHGGQSTGQIADKMFLQLYKSKLHFIRKHYGSLHGFLYKILLGVVSLSRISLGAVVWFESAERRKTHLSLVKSYRNLLFSLPKI